MMLQGIDVYKSNTNYTKIIINYPVKVNRFSTFFVKRRVLGQFAATMKCARTHAYGQIC